MIRLSRAAGFAAALLVAITGTFHATPSLAWELDGATTSLPAVSVPAAPAAPEVPAESLTTANPPAAIEAPAPEALEPAVQRAALAMDAELECLAGAVYFEAKGEPARGQLSVAKVILNRTTSGRFPKTACGVVRQHGQFSFVRGGRFPAIARASAAWKQAVSIARLARDSAVESPAGKALFFHARYVSPGWRGVTRVAVIGNHVFYR